MGMATKANLRIQGAQNKVTREKVSEVKRIPALKTSSFILKLRYRAIAATNKVTSERFSILINCDVIKLWRICVNQAEMRYQNNDTLKTNICQA